MANVSLIFNESDTDFHEKLELSLTYAGRVITEQEQWLVENPLLKSKLMKLFSKCQCYLEEPGPPVLYSTLDPNSAPFVVKSRPSLDPTIPPFMAIPVVPTDASNTGVGAVLPPMLSPAEVQATTVPVAPTWVPPPMLPTGLPLQTMASLPPYPAVFQPPYHQPLVSPQLYHLTPCQPMFEPTCQPAFVYPGQYLAPSPPLVTSPTVTPISGYSSESSMSLPATPVSSPDPIVGFPTFMPMYQAPVYDCGIPSSCYPTTYVSYPSYPCYPPMPSNSNIGYTGITGSSYPNCNMYYGPPCYGPVAY